jgi:hypothetical protein
MANSSLNTAQAQRTPKLAETADATEIAARYFVHKLFDATAGQPMRWATLRRMYESRAAIARAVERGWIILWGTSGKPLELACVAIHRGTCEKRCGAGLPARLFISSTSL